MAYIVMAYIDMAYKVLAYIVMAYTLRAYAVVAYIVMAYVAMAYVVVACIFMAYVAMAYIVTACGVPLCRTAVVCLRGTVLSTKYLRSKSVLPTFAAGLGRLALGRLGLCCWRLFAQNWFMVVPQFGCLRHCTQWL